MADDNEQIHISTVEARGAAKTGSMRYVLVISLVLIIVVFAAILMGWFG